MKEFKDVEIGDLGFDEDQCFVKIVDKGIGGDAYHDRLGSFDNTGEMLNVIQCCEDYGYSEEELEHLPMVAVVNSDGDYYVCIYGEFGVRVNHQ